MALMLRVLFLCLSPALIGCTPDGSELSPQRVQQQIESGGVKAFQQFMSAHGIHAECPGDWPDESIITSSLTTFDGWAGRESSTLAVVRNSVDWCQVLLVFSSDTPHRWVFSGVIELPREKYDSLPMERLDSGQGLEWLSVRQLEISGTGVLIYRRVLFAVVDGQLKECLSVPDRGHVVGWLTTLDMKVESRVSSVGRDEGGVPYVEIAYESALWPPEESEGSFPWSDQNPLLIERSVIRWTWDEARGALRQDYAGDPTHGSRVPDFEEIGKPDGVLKRYTLQLREIAVSGDARKVEWLQMFLSRCSRSPESIELRELCDNGASR